ncbi:MAG: GntR family transcriptional regulator, partial [Planctomycetes bacterium]|nr:GntR family transcriptional regulator [Planctomycetota bacterium]
MTTAPDLPLKRIPLHVQIALRLRSEVLTLHKPGERIGSQNELARRFGVSAITIREAVGALVQEGILERKHGSGTYVCDTESGKAIGVLIELNISFPGTSYYWTRITQQLRMYFEEDGYTTRLYTGQTYSGDPEPVQPTCKEFWQDLSLNRIRALAIVGTPINKDWLKKIEEHDIPVVYSSQCEIIPNSTVDMIREGTRYLIEHGRRKIAILAWGTSDRPYIEYHAYMTEMTAQNLPVRQEWVGFAGRSALDAFAGLEAFRRLWHASEEKPDGLLICNDLL